MEKNDKVYIAGENVFHRWSKIAREKLEFYLTPNNKGYYILPVNGGIFYTIGTSTRKYGKFAKYKNTVFKVDCWGSIYAKVGTHEAKMLVEMVKSLIEQMKNYKQSLKEEKKIKKI